MLAWQESFDALLNSPGKNRLSCKRTTSCNRTLIAFLGVDTVAVMGIHTVTPLYKFMYFPTFSVSC